MNSLDDYERAGLFGGQPVLVKKGMKVQFEGFLASLQADREKLQEIRTDAELRSLGI